MFCRFKGSTVLFLIFVLYVNTVRADELILNNGDRITGTFIKRDGDKFEFKTSYAGIIRVDSEQISEIRVDESVQLLLTNENLVNVNKIRNSGEEVVITLVPENMEYTLNEGEVVLVAPEPWQLGDGFDMSGRVDFSLKLDRGNTDKDQLDIDVEISMERIQDRFRANGQWEIDKSSGFTTKDKLDTLLEYNRFISDKYFYGLLGTVEQDEFSDLNVRTSLGPMIGSHFINKANMNLDFSGGIVAVYEEESGNNISRTYPSLAWVLRFNRMIFNDVLQFYHRHMVFMDLEQNNGVIVNSWTGLRGPSIWGIVTSLEAQLDWDTDPIAGSEKGDAVYRIKLGYQW